MTARLGVVRLWKRAFSHLKDERVPISDRLDAGLRSRLAMCIQTASLDTRSERLRRPALELAAALAADSSASGGLAVLNSGLQAACAGSSLASSAYPSKEWLE